MRKVLKTKTHLSHNKLPPSSDKLNKEVIGDG